MKPSPGQPPEALSTDVVCTTSPLAASRIVAWVSAAGAIVWGGCLVGFFGIDPTVDSSVVSLFLLVVTVHHVGQAFASTVSFKVGAWFAAVSLVAQLTTAMSVLIGEIASADILALLTTPVTCSVSALAIARRHIASFQHENDDEPISV